MDKKISSAVIKRLPRYYRYINDLLKTGIKRISSKVLSERMNITASQIRQDLNCFGGFGQQGYGYNVEMLYKEIGHIMGVDKKFNCIIIGAGNIGMALAHYENFDRRGFKLIGIFDVNKKIIGNKINDIEIFDYNDLQRFVDNHSVDIAIIAVPHDKTAKVAENVAKIGIKGLWNFSPMDLKLPYDVMIENVHLTDSLMILGYKMAEKYGKE